MELGNRMKNIKFKDKCYWKSIRQIVTTKDSVITIAPVNLLYRFFSFDEITEYRNYTLLMEIFDYEESFYARLHLNEIKIKLYKGILSRYNDLPVEVFFKTISNTKIILEININNVCLVTEVLERIQSLNFTD